MEVLSTAMDPLQIARTSREQGWRVALMDMDAIEAAGSDVAHSIACNVLQAKCDEGGWVNEHTNESIHNGAAEEGHEITELTGADRESAERLFQARDCAYRPTLEGDAGFTIIPKGQNSLWTDEYCDPSKDGTVYQELLNVETLFRGLLSQMKCKDQPYDEMPKSIDDILSGKFSLSHPPVAASQGGTSGGGGGGKGVLFLLLLVGGVAMYVRKDMISPGGGRLVPTMNRWVRAARDRAEQLAHQHYGRSGGASPEAELEPMPVSGGDVI
jgi:hypothetical protein